MRKKFSKAVISGVSLLSSPLISFAADNPMGWINNIDGTKTELNVLVVNVLNWMIGAAAVICVVMLIVAGYSYMTAGGDEGKVGKATKTLTNAIIGLAICFIAVMLVNFVLKNFLQPQALMMILHA